ncbi:hypothetical protein [Pseudomonas psychrophila]
MGDRIKLLWWDGDGLCLFCKFANGRKKCASSSRQQPAVACR